MSDSTLFDELAVLTALDAPVGFEEPVQKYAALQLAKCCDEVAQDVRGNLYAVQRAADEAAPVVMVTAHADEVGFMVTSVRADGFLRFTSLGFPTEQVLPGQRITLLTRQGRIPGVIGVKPGHILKGDEARIVPGTVDRYIDVGAADGAEAASWGIEPGTPAVFHGPLQRSQHPGRVFGKAIDNRAGVLAVLETARRLRHEPLETHRHYVITVEEEIGLRGAFVAAGRVRPDVLLAIDTVPSGGTPDVSPETLPWTIGQGPLLKVRETAGLSTHGPLRDLMRQVAAEAGIPYRVIVDTAGITDGTSAQQATGNCAAAVIGLARRYSHSAIEMLDLGDLQCAIHLLAATIRELKSVKQLSRIEL